MVVLPQHIIDKMSPKDRESLKCKTTKELVAKSDIRLEKELHELVSGHLRSYGFPFVHARMDKKSTIAVGWPDFTVCVHGKFVCFELKTPRGTLSDEQIVYQQQIISGFGDYHVVRSFQEFLDALNKS
jgi:hypothetical protein